MHGVLFIGNGDLKFGSDWRLVMTMNVFDISARFTKGDWNDAKLHDVHRSCY